MLGKPLLNVGARVCSAVLAEASEDPGIVWPATVSPVRGHDEQNISAAASESTPRTARNDSRRLASAFLGLAGIRLAATSQSAPAGVALLQLAPKPSYGVQDTRMVVARRGSAMLCLVLPVPSNRPRRRPPPSTPPAGAFYHLTVIN